LTVEHPLTFLGIEIELRTNGDAFIHQQTFTESILAKHNMSKGSGNTCVQVDKLPETPDPPSAAQLKELQGFSGEFNWLATRTRPDMSYYVSVLASACTQHCTWSQDLAKKILRYLQSSRKQGLLLTAKGDLNELNGWTDAGFAGQETKSQSGLVVTWGGTIIVWRSSKQTVSAFSTAEAELNAAALGWQIIEGLRSLIADLGVILSSVNLLVDNQAAITIADWWQLANPVFRGSWAQDSRRMCDRQGEAPALSHYNYAGRCPNQACITYRYPGAAGGYAWQTSY
jgi:hypothetical protein